MSAYAAVVSLINTMDHIQIHPRLSTSFNNNHLKSLGVTVGFLLNFIESYNCGGRSKEVEDLEAEIACAAHAAEDVIESHIVDQIRAGSAKKNLEDKIASAAHAVKDEVKCKIVNQIQGGCTEYDLEEEIASAVDAAEDVIESNILEQILDMLKKLKKLPLPSAMCDLRKVTKDMDSIKVSIIARFQDEKSTPPPAASSSPVNIAGKTSMVGFEEYLIQLMNKLTWHQSHQQVIPIVGMGGVGKTTLAQNAFDNLLIKQHFDVRAWATISQTYTTREILLEVLSSQEDRKNLVDLNEPILGEKLYKYLCGKRYLIILDDMWSTVAWNDIKFFFPDNSNGSRIVVTTRLVNVAVQLNSSYFPVNLLDEDKSWNLFCQETFGEDGCPAELDEVGKRICENCKGLPLSIVVIGGFLQKSSKSREYWEGVARDTYSILNSEGDNQCMNILSLSYNYLPAHLKPCFLYMGTFAEDEEVLVSRLVKLWVAEGFLKPNDAQSLEEVAMGYLEDLVGRNLILVNRWGSNGKIRGCKIHDLIRELCLSLAEKEKFLCVMKSTRSINRERRIVIHESLSNANIFDVLGSVSVVRSWICNGNTRLDSKLLRVLCAVDNVPNRHFLETDLSHVNLRCLDIRYVQYYTHLYIPRKISLLWNLQMLIMKGNRGNFIAPSEIWETVELRHLQFYRLWLPDPPQDERRYHVLTNLQTLGNVVNFQLSKEVCKRIPNVKKLKLMYNNWPQGCDAFSYYCPQNLGRFHKLESLTLTFGGPFWRPMVLNMTFPSSLKKLTLNLGAVYWEELEMVGSLPNLQVLKLLNASITGSEWSPVEGQFGRLKYLEIHNCVTLTKWNADSSHFPVLEKLYLTILPKLEEIPSGIGEIPTLQIICLRQCSTSCSLSAVKILEERESDGNDDLQVEIKYFMYTERDSFKEMVAQQVGFTSKNLHIH